MTAAELCGRRLNEMVAATAIFGDRLTDVTASYESAAAAVAAGETQDLEASVAALARSSCSGSIACRDHSVQATLEFTMPHDYPDSPMHCHVTSPHLPRDVTDALSTHLQQRAAAVQGSECLHELVETLDQQLNEVHNKLAQQQQQQPCTATVKASSSELLATASNGQAGVAAAVGANSLAAASTESRRCVLLRLDHMRSKPSYCKTIKQWATELHLTGFLLCWQSLILIVLEGTSKSLSQYLYLARTVCVDVDASGRKCRERMLTVLEDSSSSIGGVSRAPSSNSTTMITNHSDFRVLEAGDLDEVVSLLQPTHPQYTRAVLLGLIGSSNKPQ